MKGTKLLTVWLHENMFGDRGCLHLEHLWRSFCSTCFPHNDDCDGSFREGLDEVPGLEAGHILDIDILNLKQNIPQLQSVICWTHTRTKGVLSETLASQKQFHLKEFRSYISSCSSIYS